MGAGAPDLKSAPGQGTPRRRAAWPVSRTEGTTKTTQEVCQIWLQSVPLPPTPSPSSLLWFCYISERTMNCSNAQNLCCVRSKYRSLGQDRSCWGHPCPVDRRMITFYILRRAPAIQMLPHALPKKAPVPDSHPALMIK